MSEFSVRQLTLHDAADYQRLRLLGLQESPAAFSSSYEQEAGRTMDEIAARVNSAPDGSRCVFGAFVDDQLVGLVAVIRPPQEKLRHSAELAGMYVAPEFRQCGLGQALLAVALEHARSLAGVRQIRLGVNAANKAAIALYQSVGFTRYGTEPEALFIDGCYYDLESYFLRLAECG